jgi:Pyruvate/2-oxoacid:ferredoxin oxidoreductase delta subunit
MSVRKIIEIDEDKCNGCGICIPNCPEGALQVIDGKARLVSDLFCDGLGACIGECPEDAIHVIEREAQAYDETEVMKNIVRQGKNVIKAHLKHLRDHNETGLLAEAEKYLVEKNIGNPLEEQEETDGKLPCGCPGSKVMDLRKDSRDDDSICTEPLVDNSTSDGRIEKVAQIEELLRQIKDEKESKLRQWPVQITLVPPNAPYLDGADILLAADCVPFAYAGFHEDLLEGKVLLVGCPKLDDTGFYINKITEIIKSNDIKSITVAHMEVPCCSGMLRIVDQAIKDSGKDVPLRSIEIGIKGKILSAK